MASKLQAYRAMAEQAQRQLTGSLERWQSFLTTAARLYKYPYHEQVMIHAQRPDATACAEYDVWNNTMRRYVRRGSKGIALIDTSGDRDRLRYVFDVSDTGTRPNSRNLNLWTLRDEHLPAVTAMLESRYDAPAGADIREQLEAVASSLAREYWDENKRDVLDIVEASFLEEYDEFNVGVAFRNAAEVSITYSLMSRCGLAPELYYEHEDFMSVFDFNTPETAGALGTAVSGINQQLLREIGAVIRNYEREKLAERSMEHGNDLQANRGLSDPGYSADRAGSEASREVRADAENVSEGASSDPVEPTDPVGTAIPPLAGDRRDGASASGRDASEDGSSGGSDRGYETERPAEMGRADEQPEGAGRRDSPDGAGVQLSSEPAPEPAYEQLTLNLFPPEQEQISQIDEADSTSDVPSVFSFSQAEVDDVLRFGSNTEHSRERIVDAFQKGKSIADIAVLLEREFYGGYGIKGEHGDYSAWYAEDGIRVHKGRSARHEADAQLVSWEDAAVRIQELLAEGRYATNVEITEADGYVRRELAQHLLFMKHDLSEEANRQGYLSCMDDLPAGYPDATEALLERFSDPAFKEQLRAEFSSYWDAYVEDFSLLRFHYHRLDVLWQGINELSASRQELPEGFPAHSEVPVFITEDEIDAALAGGSSVSGGKGRIYRFFSESHTAKEQADFLKDEYGIGGRSHAVSGAVHSHEDYSAKGIRLQKDGCTPVELSWKKAAERIASMVQERRFLSATEQAMYDGVRGGMELAEADEIATQIAEGEPEAQSTPENREVAPRELTQEDIDHAIQEWNGSIESKHAVVRYMEAHAREKDTAAWLRQEFGDDLPAFPVTADGAAGDVPWARVQRRIAQLIRQGRFYTEAEQDRFDDIDPIAIREELAQRGIVNGQVADPEKLASDPFIQQVMQDVEQIAAADTAAQEPAGQEMPARDPLAPAYQAGDTVYLEGQEYQITGVGTHSVELLPPGLRYPVFRSESIPTFERLLKQDDRNEGITEYLPVPLADMNADVREVLTGEGGLLFGETLEDVADLFRTGAGNSRIAGHLSETFAGTTDTMELLTGDTADYFASGAGLEIHIHDKFHTVLALRWQDIAANLRTVFQLGQDGLTHTPAQQAQEAETAPELEAVPPQSAPTIHTETEAVYPGDKTGLPYDVEIRRLRVEPETPTPAPEPEMTMDEVLDEHPISIPINGEWQTFPNQQAAEKAAYEEHKDRLRRSAENFHITDDHLGEGGPKVKYQANVNAIRLLKELEADGRQASPEQQQVLSRYVGWGGLADAFDPSKESWSKEYAELQGLMTPEEYDAARASTLNAHYTSPTVIKAIYEVVGNMGFETGNILEPSMGVGNFFGLLPENMSGSRLYGVELDSITGRIAKQLYPKANITVAGFETTDRRDFFDLAVGNVPFGQYQVNDKAYNKLGFSIHDYFFAKALDQVRPGGVVAFVTSRYTMDKQSPEVRKYIAKRADLLGAIRLPNNAFKANAGTEVVSDILFLQRRDRPIEIEPEWVHLGQSENGFAINSYFVEHPEMVLGTPTAESTQYGRQDYTVAPIEGAVLSEQLHDAIRHIRGTYQAAELPELAEGEDIADTLPADPSVRNYSYTVVDGEVYYRQDSLMSKPALNATATERVKGMVELRDCLRRLIDQQMDAGVPDEEIRETQSELNALYDRFTAQYGLINGRANALAFQDDSSYYLLCTLEELDEEKQLKRKADIFTKRTIRPHEVVTSVDTPSEALALSLSEKARVDLPYMAELTGMDEQELIDGLQGVIFRDPIQGQWQTADEYLSGNVRQKLRAAEQAADADPAYLSNVEALRRSQPKDLDASEIEVRLGTTWIDPRYIQQFMEETFEPPFYLRRGIQVHYSPFTAEWSISGKSTPSYSDVNAYMTYGTDRANAYRILEDTLNLRDVRIYDTKTDPDGKERRVLNSKETTLAQQKQQAIKDAFREWIWRDPDRRRVLVQKYNELFNSNRPREYDGQHIAFSGMNPEIHLREHQLNAVAHILYGGNTLLAHEVGAGKTFEMVAAAMESKRLGLCHKPLFVVPNHLTEQWASEFLRLYPSANILAATKKDFEPKSRKKFCARIATGDYDAIIIGHSQFERIPVSVERQERLLREQIAEVTEGIAELRESRAERFTIKSMERTKKGLEAKLKKLMESGRKDDVVTFEELGVDRLYVDEAHNFKNLFLYTKMRNVAGLSATDAQKSSDMLLKCRYIDEMTGGKGVVFATGTPVSNSMTELYTMMRYLQHDTLKKTGLAHFDCWASTFGETTTAIELAPEGTGYRARTRFAKFFNLPELMTLFKEVADIKTSDQLHLPVPEAVYHNVVAQPTEIQQAMVQELSERAARVHSGSVDASVDNMLKITTDGRKLGLDQRIINPDLPDDPSSKVNLCVDNIFRIWQDGQADRLTQLVFCDLSTPKTGAPAARAAKTVGGNLDSPELHAVADAVKEDAPEPEFTVYDDIREKLVRMGVPREQIAFIHEANTEARKKDLFTKVRSGQVRVLMGSTFKMGAGMNVQDRLIALHDLDAPWRPGDLEQRSGRIIRQGNQNKQVHIYRYVTEATFDAYLWQTLENKQKFISQIMTSKSPVRSCDDIDETALSYAEIKALCAGDDRIREKMDLDVDVARLKLMKANHQSQQFRLEDNILRHFPEQIEQNKGFIAGFQADLATLAAHPHPKDGFAGMEVRGDLLTDKENAGAALVDAMKEVKGLEPVAIGSYRGFQMSLTLEDFGKQYILTLKGRMSHRVELGKDPRGNLVRIDNVLSGMDGRLARVQEKLDALYVQLETAKAELGKPFPQEQELREKSARLAQLNIELNIDDRTPLEAMMDVAGPAQTTRDTVIPKGTGKPSVLARLSTPLPKRAASGKPHEAEKEVR